MAGSARALWRAAVHVVSRVRKHNVLMMAAAIAFYWLLSLIPLLLVGTVAIGYFLGSPDRAVDDVIAAVSRLAPRASRAGVATFFGDLIRSHQVTGILGLAALLWGAMGAFGVITSSLTILTGGGDSRSFLRRKFVSLVLMSSAGLLLAIALLGSWFLQAWPNIEMLLETRIVLPAFLADPDFPRYLASLLVALLLTIIYRVAPAREIGWPAALAGAAIAGLLWHMAKLGFNWFILYYSRINLFFGMLTGVTVLVLWIFSTAIILLVGGILADIIDRGCRPNQFTEGPVLKNLPGLE